jgi:hypothetical protein
MRIFHSCNAHNTHERHCSGKIKNKQLVVSHEDDNIDPYFSNDPNVKYLTSTDQMDKFKPTEYYIIFDFDTMEVIKDKVFYDKNVYKWFPNPNQPKEEQTRDKKKLLGVSFEKEGYIMYAIAPKSYILKSSKNDND